MTTLSAQQQETENGNQIDEPNHAAAPRTMRAPADAFSFRDARDQDIGEAAENQTVERDEDE